jgi:fluoroquinolone resistance protein
MTMKKYLVLPIAICATTFSFAAQSQIPEKYLGNWAEKKSDCIIPPGSPIDFPDAGIKITQDAIHQYEAGCTLKKVISESDNAFSAEFVRPQDCIFKSRGNMQTPFANEKEFLSKTFSNISAINQEICNVEFEGCHFQDCNFTESIFKKCRFIECTFTRCNLSVIKVPQSQFTDVVFDECKLVGVDWTRASWPRLVFSVSLKFNKCIINDSSFFGLSLDEIAIEECKAQDVDFRDGSFCRASFYIHGFHQ